MLLHKMAFVKLDSVFFMLLNSLKILGKFLGWIPGFFELIIDRIAGHRFQGMVLERSWAGQKVDFDLSDYIQRKAYFSGFERRELSFIRKSSQLGSTGIDVGANVGLITLVMAQAVGASGSVIAIEPIPENFSRLKAATQFHPQIQARNIACGNGLTSTLRLFRFHNPGSDSSKTSAWYSIVSNDPQDTFIEVPCIRLEDQLTQDGVSRSISILKIDVEGAEELVLQGCGRFLNPVSISRLMLEAVVSRNGFREEDERVFSILENAGYQICPISFMGKPMNCSLTSYVASRWHHVYWALRYFPMLNLNYCAVSRESTS
jgi:FkbM family methyltransferase